MQSNPVAPRPFGHWERVTDAAKRVGLKVDIFRSELTAAGSEIRTARIGRRGILHVASLDVDDFGRRLAAGECGR